MKSKLDWVKSLKVGDLVCDCSFKHQAIVSIKEIYTANTSNSLKNKIYYLMPNSIYPLFHKIFIFFNITKLFDKDLILEDGNGCSAYYCCDPIDHVQKHN